MPEAASNQHPIKRTLVNSVHKRKYTEMDTNFMNKSFISASTVSPNKYMKIKCTVPNSDVEAESSFKRAKCTYIY